MQNDNFQIFYFNIVYFKIINISPQRIYKIVALEH